eukprot:566397-Pyramimonas_sp.AAC.1
MATIATAVVSSLLLSSPPLPPVFRNGLAKRMTVMSVVVAFIWPAGAPMMSRYCPAGVPIVLNATRCELVREIC